MGTRIGSYVIFVQRKCHPSLSVDAASALAHSLVRETKLGIMLVSPS